MSGSGSEALPWKMHARGVHYHPDTVAWITALIGHEPTGPELRELEAMGAIKPDEIVDVPGNLATTAGVTRVANLITGGGAQALTNSRAVVGIGDGTGTVAVGDTDLFAAAGSTHRWFQGVDASYPSVSGGVITISSTFASADGNFTWAEWCFGIASATPVPSSVIGTALGSGIMMNHKVQAMGAKSAGGVSTCQATMTVG
jgi:hypothetical protein